MKIRKVEREIRHKIYVGGYEMIEPCIRLSATLDDGDDVEDAMKQIDEIIVPMWAREVLSEIRLVHRRRGDNPPENDKTAQLMGAFKDELRRMKNTEANS